MEQRDAVIVGAGPAGLTAAIYMARYRRKVLVLGTGASRASWIPESHNTPGFPHGVGGDELLARLTAQALQFGVETRDATVQSVAVTAAGGFEILGWNAGIAAPTVLLATGVRDRMPDVPGIEAAVRRSLVRMCPICDAYEATHKRIAVLGDGGLAEREAAFLRTYSDDVTVIGTGDGELAFDDHAVQWTRPGEPARTFDHLYLALGCDPQSSLAVECGARRDEDGNLIVDAHQMTSVEGLYAAGDVVRGLNQIAVATGEAAIAATAMHNRLRRAAT